jgi:hypothetical protein
MPEIDRTEGRTEQRVGASSADKPEQERVEELADRARQQAAQLAERGRERAAHQINLFAETLRETGGKLEERHSPLASYVEKAADKLERISELARTKDPRDLVRGVERFARRDRAIFLGGAFTLGLIAARFLSSTSRYQRTEEMGRIRKGEPQLAVEEDVEVAYVAPVTPSEGVPGEGISRSMEQR